jgi:hypothetical protein
MLGRYKLERTDLVVIDMDLIASLRSEGKGLEAKEMLQTYYLNKAKEKEQLKKEIKRDTYKKQQIRRNFKNGRKKKT